MARSRFFRSFIALIMVLTLAGSILVGQTAVLAQGPMPGLNPNLRLDVRYPALAAPSGYSFSFEVNLRLTDSLESRLFNLSTTSLDGWRVTTTAASSGKEVSAVQITPYDDPTYPVTETIIVTLSPYTQIYPQPGEYKITFKASSEALTQSIDLVGTVIPSYAFIMTTETTNLYYVYQNSSPTIYIPGGKDSYFSFNVVNKGSATIENLALSSTHSEGWKVSFQPGTISSLGADMMQQVNVTITPPDGDVAGDYQMKFKADNGTISSVMDVRATVVERTFPAWATMIIIAGVVMGLALGYQRFFNKPRKKIG